jgi:hypothetical protein
MLIPSGVQLQDPGGAGSGGSTPLNNTWKCVQGLDSAARLKKVSVADLSHVQLQEEEGDPLSGDSVHPKLHLQQGGPSGSCQG